jgi:hypothetical protein
MKHVDDYLDEPGGDPIAKEFLEHARRPAVEKDHAWLKANSPTVTWRGSRFLCVGASRLGDVWLREFNLTGAFYDHRVDIAELSDWQRPALQHTEPTK